MANNTLVTYATCTGSTVGVAEKIAEVLQANNSKATALPMQDVDDLTPYDVIVFGSAIQDKKWLPEAKEFLRKNQAVIAQKQTAMFTVCMTLVMKNGEAYRPAIYEWVSKERAIIQPSSENIFAGALNIKKIPYLGARIGFRLSVLFGVWKEGDHRDWDAIQAWAEELSALL
mgnify:CR=1 FL=1